MNYVYTIENSSYSPNEKKIIESSNNKMIRVWYVKQLKYVKTKNLSKLVDSFVRTRNWLLENHPELLL